MTSLKIFLLKKQPAINEEWQQQACNILGLDFVATSNFASHTGGLSRKFGSGENFGPGPFFAGKIVLPGMIFPEKMGRA